MKKLSTHLRGYLSYFSFLLLCAFSLQVSAQEGVNTLKQGNTSQAELKVVYSSEPIDGVPLIKGQTMPITGVDPSVESILPGQTISDPGNLSSEEVSSGVITGQIVNKIPYSGQLAADPSSNASEGLSTGADPITIPGDDPQQDAVGTFILSSAGPHAIPETGHLSVLMHNNNTLPEGAVITNVTYRLRIDDTGDEGTFYCGDYQVFLSTAANGAPNPFLNVYDNLGGRTDGGFDDDAEDDSDIYLNMRSTSAFNGEDAEQNFSLWIEDDFVGDLGQLDYIEFHVDWESPDPTITNLDASYTPSGWDAPFVVSSVTGTNTDGPTIVQGATSYIDVSYACRYVDIPAGTNVYLYLYAGGSYVAGWYWDGIQQDYLGVVEDFEYVFPTSGSVAVSTSVDPDNLITEYDETDNTYSRDIAVEPGGTLPNLIADYTPSGWDAPIVVSSVTGTNTDGPNLQEGAPTYIDIAYVNRDATIPVGTPVYVYLYSDDNFITGWWWDGIGQNFYGHVQDFEITFAAGTVTLETRVDRDNTIAESNESDNTYSRSVIFSASDPDIEVTPTSITIDEPAPETSVYNAKDDQAGDEPIQDEGRHRLGLIIPPEVEAYWANRESSINYDLNALEDAIDWSGDDSPVKNQGNCGSCWAFAAVAIVENLGLQNDLSEQELVACIAGSDCDGGYYTDAFTYMQTTGVGPEACYPYFADNGNCLDKCTDPAFLEKLTTYTTLWGTTYTVDDLRAALNNGPLVVGMLVPDDGSFDSYDGGIYNYDGPYSIAGAHAVLAVGYDDAQQFFIVKNSWGSGWGENGYFRIAYDDVTDDIQFGRYAATIDGVYTESIENGFTICNQGYGVLTVNSINSDQAWLSTTGYPATPFDLTGGLCDAVEVVIDWNLVNNQTEVGVITINSNDPDEPNVNIPVTVNKAITQPLDCSSAVEITSFPSEIQGNSDDGVANVNMYSCNTWNEGGKETVYMFTAPSTGQVEIDLDFDAPTDLDLFVLASCDENDCLYAFTANSPGIIDVTDGNTYYIVVDEWQDANGIINGGPFTLTVDLIQANQAPIVVNPIPDQVFTKGFVSADLDLSNVFEDPDGDPLTVTHIDYIPNNIFSHSFVPWMLTLLEEDDLGTVAITVIVSDGDLVVSDQFLVTVEELPELNIPLVTGWNWFSVNTLGDDMSLGNTITCLTNDDYIKTLTASATYFENFGWFGSLEDAGGLNPTELFKIKATNPCAVHYMGMPVDVAATPINIVSGWNWIAYQPQCILPIAEALGSLTLEEDDYIKNQTSSATYFENYGWFGSLEELVPGEGYMMKKLSADLLTYPECPPGSGSIKKKASINRGPGRTVDPYKFEFNGTVTAKVYLDGRLTGSEDDLLLAYVNDQLRGVSKGIYFDPTESYAFPLMIHSNEADGESVTFQYYSAENDVFYPCDGSIAFYDDMIHSSAFDPFVLHVNSTLAIEETRDVESISLEVYPNPFENLLQIEYVLVERSKLRLEVYDVLGKKVEILDDRTIDPGSYNMVWNASTVHAGTYFLKLTTGTSSIMKKIVLIK